MAGKKDILSGVWAIAITSGTTGLIGRVKGEDLEKGEVKEEVRNRVFGRPVVVFEFALDYFAPLQPRPMLDPQAPPGSPPRMTWSREPIITGHDFTMYEVTIAARWERLEFLADMDKQDRERYEMFILQTMEGIVRTRLQAAGIVAPSGDKNIEDAIAAIAATAKNGGSPLILK